MPVSLVGRYEIGEIILNSEVLDPSMIKSVLVDPMLEIFTSLSLFTFLEASM
jgi:hypothetical protein